MKQASLFVDEALLEVRSGSGGNGKVSFRREKFIAKGGPNGGDGGRGGDVILVADNNVATLLDFKSARRIRAESGEHGGVSDRKGASGSDVEIRVPVGTLVFDETPRDPGEETQEADPARLLADLTRPGQRLVVARGGRGGLGNARFKTATRQAPDFATPGRPGETRQIRLSLKLMADVGLVGFPNAGKSTLLRRISAARPRVANYPFTTLVPSLGVVERDDRRCVVADIPGLIEGASEGAGLGHQFLRHVERTRVLVHLLDLEAMLVEGRDLMKDYEAIRRELGRYRPELLERQEILVLNKSDLVHDEALVAPLLERLTERGLRPLQVSSAASQGLDLLLRSMFEAVEDARREAAVDETGREQD
ncbi:MAG TPA: GTPase ObgE [Deltaproteobacteria bacterium]|nr:GTPase ObgE [Deltaproteobacteria bacterium]